MTTTSGWNCDTVRIHCWRTWEHRSLSRSTAPEGIRTKPPSVNPQPGALDTRTCTVRPDCASSPDLERPGHLVAHHQHSGGADGCGGHLRRRPLQRAGAGRPAVTSDEHQQHRHEPDRGHHPGAP